jgi:hypothetical protein
MCLADTVYFSHTAREVICLTRTAGITWRAVIVSVQCSHQINVLVMDDAAYDRYKRGLLQSPETGLQRRARLGSPAGHRATYRYSINVIRQ